MEQETPLFLFVYFGGHGVAHKSQQFACLNSSIPNEALYPIEFKLRYLCENVLNTMRIFAFFDCCNTPLSNHKGIFDTVERKGMQDGEFADLEQCKINDKPCPYFHLSPARPAGVAAANAGNAQKVLDWMGHFSQQLPVGFLRIASDLT